MDGERDGFTRTAVASLTPAHRRMPYRFITREASAAVLAQHAVFWMFVTALAWTPFWYGSNVPLAWGVNAIVFPGLVLVLETALIASGTRHAVSWRSIAGPFICVAAVFVFIVLQNATWTPRSWHHPIWAMAADTLSRPLDGSISVNRDVTLQALLRFVTAASVLWLALQLCRDALRANRLMLALAAIGAVYAAYGLAVRTVNAGGFVSSTFYNRNHFATYAAMGLIVAFGLLIRLYRDVPARDVSLRLRLADFLDTTGKAGALYGAAVTVMATALMLTGSRGGIASFAAGSLVLAFLVFGQRHRSSGEQAAVIGLFGLLVAVVFVVFGDSVLGKIENLGFTDDARLAVYRLTAGSILEAPLLGHGYGTFADVFPMFRDRSIDVAGIWTSAHNTYLEILQGLGLVFGALLLLAIGLMVMRCLAGAATRKVDATIPAIAASVGCMAAFNALVDFSLEIQAVTLTFFAILGVGVAQGTSSRVDLQD